MSLRHLLPIRTRGCARNPLRRHIDDVETAIMTGLIVLFLVAAPLLCVFTGRLADAAGLREQRAEQTWRAVPAVLEQSAAQGLAGQDAASFRQGREGNFAALAGAVLIPPRRIGQRSWRRNGSAGAAGATRTRTSTG